MKKNKVIIPILVLVALVVFLFRPSTDYDVEALNKELENKWSQNDEVTLLSGSHSVDKMNSKLMWEGKKVIGTSHSGDIKIKNSNIEVDSDGTVSGNIEIDMKSINNTDLSGNSKSKLEMHLKSPDFFDVDNHETGEITFKSVKRDKNMIDFMGDLTIKGITHPISFKAYMTQDESENILSKSVIVFDRAKYDVRYGSDTFFDNLGDDIIADDIKLDIEMLIRPNNVYTSR